MEDKNPQSSAELCKKVDEGSLFDLSRSDSSQESRRERTEFLQAMIDCDMNSADARQYNQEALRLSLIDKAADFVYLGVAGLLLAKPYEQYLATFDVLSRCEWLRLAVLLLSFYLLHVVISLPLSFLSGYRLEHKYKLSRQTFAGWSWKLAKQMVLIGLIDVLFMSGLYYIIRFCGIWWIPAATGLFFLIGIVFGVILPVVVLPLFYKIERLDDTSLLDRLKKLTEGTSLKLEGVYRMNLSQETVKANAMLAGLGPSRRVILGDTLLDSFDPDEIETVFAHEMGHHVHGHIMKLIPAGVLFSLFAFFLCDASIRWLSGYSPWGLLESFFPGYWSALSSNSADSGAVFSYLTLPIWTIIAIKFFLSVLFMLYEPFSNGISRRFERQADEYALTHTGKDPYVRAFSKLAILNKADPAPPKWEVFWFYSHPPIQERIDMAQNAQD